MELRDYIDVLYNRKWVVVGTLCVVLAIALTLSFAVSPTYQSSVRILADKYSSSEALLGGPLPGSVSETDRFVQNQAEIIQTDALARRVEQQLKYEWEQVAREGGSTGPVFSLEDVPTAARLKAMVGVRLGARTGIFDIVVSGGDRRLTAEVARVYAEEYLSGRQLAAIKQISEARKEVWNQLTEVEEQIQRVAREAKQYKAGEVPTDLVAAAQQAASLWATLYEKYITLRISESLEQRGLEIIEAADTGRKVSPKPVRNLVLAVFLGLILGVGLAFFIDYMDDTLRTREDFTRYYDTPVVGEIPFVSDEELPAFRVIYFEKPGHLAVEGYRTLRTNLPFLNLDAGRGMVLFTSASPEEGKSTIIANLGAALSELGKKVLLVEADLRKPVLERFFNIQAREGLTGVLAGTSTLEEAVHDTGRDNLTLLPAGTRPPNPGEMVSSERMGKLLEQAKGMADYVLVDAPPVLAANDSLAMAPMVEGVLVVGRYGIAERDSARRTVELLRKVNANILGLVINNLETGRRYGYYHYQYYDSGAGPRSGKTRGRKRKDTTGSP